MTSHTQALRKAAFTGRVRCSVGYHQRSSREANRRFFENVEHVLDRLPEGDFGRTEDRNVPELALG